MMTATPSASPNNPKASVNCEMPSNSTKTIETRALKDALEKYINNTKVLNQNLQL